jgi:hypothetical protein
MKERPFTLKRGPSSGKTGPHGTRDGLFTPQDARTRDDLCADAMTRPRTDDARPRKHDALWW